MDHSIDVAVPHTHPVFAGHFPARPIVPGVALLDWALTEIEIREKCRLLPGQLSVAKFLNPVSPGAALTILYRFTQNGSIDLRIECEHLAIATATFRLTPI